MPSSDADSPEFTTINWSGEFGHWFRPEARTAGLVFALASLAGLFAYDFLVAPDELVAFMNWDVTQMDWLYLLSSILFVRYAVVPLVTNYQRSMRYARTILTRPAGVLSLAYILLFAVLGAIGPEQLFALEYPRLKYKLQPPVYTAAYISDISYYNCVGEVVNGYCYGTWKYPLGTTETGRNVLKHLVYGMQIGLKLGLSAAMIMAVIATAVGTTAGYYGGRIDDILMRFVDTVQVVPAIVVYMVVAIMYLGTIQGISDGGLFALALVWGLLAWGGMARLIRSEAIQHRTDGYVRAAKAAGASDIHIIRKHVIPNSTATIVTALTRQIPLLILAQVALAFLKLNSVGQRSLGRMIRIGLTGTYNVAWYEKWWVSSFAILFLILTVVAFSVFGDVVRDVLNPQEGA